MVSLTSLWLPIVLSAVVVFFASFIVHMLLPYHRTDFKKLPSEDELMDALRRFNVPPGDYMAPRANGPSAMRDPAFLEKFKRGPVFTATFMPGGAPTMGPQLAQYFVHCLVVSLFAGYLASRALPAGAEYLRVSQIASTAAFLAYAMSKWSDFIWYRRALSTTVKVTIDGVIYGLLTGGVFGWLWPR